MQKTLTVREAALAVGISERALWQQIYRGRFPHRRWGRKVVILEDEVTQFLRLLPGPALDDVVARAEVAAR